ncbi:MAG TPA: helix-turn-helix domain-containing protein [Hyphomicrobiales bacterium]|nr:helix-turn-helix domain-containing protein [Hyphomicrobiales bacterium]
MDRLQDIPQFHLYGEAAEDQAYDFIHAEPLTARSAVNDWVIAPHSHRYLHQIMYVAVGGGAFTAETETVTFGDNTLIVLAPTVVHSFRFEPESEGIVISFTEDVIRDIADRQGTLTTRLAAAERATVIPLSERKRAARITGLARDILDELKLGRSGAQIAMRSYLALLIVEIARLDLPAPGLQGGKPSALDETVARLRELVEDNFRTTRNLSTYADWLAMTPDRLNDHCKKVAGVTAGHLVRQRLLVEAKRQLIFTGQSVSEIAYSLNFSDPSYFSRFFRKYTGQTPQQFREGRR